MDGTSSAIAVTPVHGCGVLLLKGCLYGIVLAEGVPTPHAGGEGGAHGRFEDTRVQLYDRLTSCREGKPSVAFVTRSQADERVTILHLSEPSPQMDYRENCNGGAVVVQRLMGDRALAFRKI